MNTHQHLIKSLQMLHSTNWINQYFDLLKKLLTELNLEDDNPRLAMSITNRNLPVNLGQRYILKPLPHQQIGIIVPEMFEEVAVNGETIFWFKKNGRIEA